MVGQAENHGALHYEKRTHRLPEPDQLQRQPFELKTAPIQTAGQDQTVNGQRRKKESAQKKACQDNKIGNAHKDDRAQTIVSEGQERPRRGYSRGNADTVVAGEGRKTTAT
eukprot:12815206-Heterocapsa_arctica.AAC.1